MGLGFQFLLENNLSGSDLLISKGIYKVWMSKILFGLRKTRSTLLLQGASLGKGPATKWDEFLGKFQTAFDSPLPSFLENYIAIFYNVEAKQCTENPFSGKQMCCRYWEDQKSQQIHPLQT